jgi:hypothetical protein
MTVTMMILAVALGTSFGVVLDRVGASNPNYVIRMLNLSDLHLMKTILLGIGVASILLFGGLLLGLVDVGHLSIKTAHLGVFVGGLLLGTGFAVSGFCPGTGIVAAATGRKDAVFFLLGGLLGVGAYMMSYSWIRGTGLLEEVFGGKATLGKISNIDLPALFGQLPGEWLGLVGGLVLAVIAVSLPDKIREGSAG